MVILWGEQVLLTAPPPLVNTVITQSAFLSHLIWVTTASVLFQLQPHAADKRKTLNHKIDAVLTVPVPEQNTGSLNHPYSQLIESRLQALLSSPTEMH